MQNWLIAFLSGTALLVAGCGGDAPALVAPRTVLVRTAGPALAQSQMTLSGEVRARHETDLAFRVCLLYTSRCV